MKNLYVFSNLRGMQEFLKKEKKAFASEALSIEAFLSQAILVRGKKKAPPILQKILLAQVFKEFEFSDSQKQFLFFEHNFLGFLETFSFLFKLFSEAFESGIEIKEMMAMDVYGEYEDHLRVIERIYQSYQEKLSLAGYYDFPYRAEVFWDFLSAFDRIDFFIEGILSSFELEIFLQIAQRIPLFLHLSIDSFNLSYFSSLFPSLKADCAYIVCLSTSEIIQETPRELKSIFQIQACDFRVDQCSIVIERVNRWLKEGIDPEKIAVVVPNHDFLPLLMACDEGGNFNYAMGREAIEQFASLEEVQCIEGDLLQRLIFEVEERIKEISSSLRTRLDQVLLGLEQSAQYLQNFSFQELVWLFLREVQNLREEDRQGGKVRVIEILETRGMEFDRVVVVDFNQDQIPTLSNHDMFLNTSVRKRLKMPTIKDKQNLQKHYYLELFKNTQEVQLLYLKGKMANFIRELDLEAYQSEVEDTPLLTLFPPHQTREYQEDEFEASIPADMELSPTSLNLFKECKRKFYFYYIRKWAEKETEEELERGQMIHRILCQVYQENQDPSNIKQQVLRQFFNLQEISKDNHRLQMQYQIMIRELQKFLDLEINNFPDEILSLEESFSFEFEGFKLKGAIDRIDKMGDEIRVIDYKYTSKEKSSEKTKLKSYVLQAAIYYLYALEKFGTDVGVYFAMLKDGEYHQCRQDFLQEGIEELRGLLSQVFQERSFAKTDKSGVCNQCVYKILCNR